MASQSPYRGCPGCELARLRGPLTLIVVGALLLAHMLRPGFSGAVLIAVFLLFLGGVPLLAHLLPHPEGGGDPRPHPGRRGLFGPLLAIAIGVLILVRHWQPAFPLGAWIARYWPVVLIVWGVTKLIEHYTRAPRKRIGFGGGELLLVIVIIIVGTAFSGGYHFSHSRWGQYWGVNPAAWNPLLDRYTFQASQSAALGGATAVRVEGFRGDVRLVAAPGATSVSAAVSDVVRADGHDRAQQLFSASRPVLRIEGNELVVMPGGSEGPDGPGGPAGRLGGNAWQPNLRADVVLTLPPTLPVTVHLESGDVSAQDWRAGLSVRSGHGSVTLGQIAGNVTIEAGHGSVSLDHIAGDVTVRGSGDDVAISNVRGRTAVTGGFVGSLSFRDLVCPGACPASLRFDSPRTSWTITSLPGSLSDDMGQISLDQVHGVSLRTRDAEVDISRFTGPLDVTTRNQRVLLRADAPPAAITVNNQNADITLELPPASRIQLEANARNGSVNNAFPAAPGGAPIQLSTSNGTITVRPRE